MARIFKLFWSPMEPWVMSIYVKLDEHICSFSFLNNYSQTADCTKNGEENKKRQWRWTSNVIVDDWDAIKFGEICPTNNLFGETLGKSSVERSEEHVMRFSRKWAQKKSQLRYGFITNASKRIVSNNRQKHLLKTNTRKKWKNQRK